MKLLSSEGITKGLAGLPDWSKHKSAIKKTYEAKDFLGAMGFVFRIAILAEKANHHPDIDIRWNRVTLSLSTHSDHGLTSKDFALAGEIEAAWALTGA